MRYLVSQDAAPQIKLEAATQAVRSLEEKGWNLLFSFTSAKTQLSERAQTLEVDAQTLEAQKREAISWPNFSTSRAGPRTANWSSHPFLER